jgi:hypothetical protein
MTLQRFLREAQQLAHHLDMHHKIVSRAAGKVVMRIADSMPW